MEKAEFGVMIMAADTFGDKALWPILDKPVIGYLLKNILECNPKGVSVAVKQEDGPLRDYLENFPSVAVIGNGSAETHEWAERFPILFMLGGALPFLSAETIRSFVYGHIESRITPNNLSGIDCSILGDAPYGMVFDPDWLTETRGDVLSLSGLVEFFDLAGAKTWEYPLGASEAPPILNQADLAAASTRMRETIVQKWMEKGVQVMDPNAIWIGSDVELEPGVCLMPGAQIWGHSSVGAGSVVGPYCILRNAVLGKGVNLISNVIVEDSKLNDYAKAGPFAYIRESSVLKEHSFAGKFVEIKKTTIGCGSKVPHLSYMGDAFLGENVNIGAGSVTCNYDGVGKHQTKIGNRCFVGSDTMMVAPVTLGDDAMTAAGSTITNDVPSGALAVGRARQKNLEGWSLRRKQEMQGKQAKK